jgi:hypothetical protein
LKSSLHIDSIKDYITVENGYGDKTHRLYPGLDPGSEPEVYFIPDQSQQK